jgi:hypothetical protein
LIELLILYLPGGSEENTKNLSEDKWCACRYSNGARPYIGTATPTHSIVVSGINRNDRNFVTRI